MIHTGGASHDSPWGGDQTAFTESMAEAGKAVSDYLGNGENIVYINVMNRISIDCDCDGNPSEPASWLLPTRWRWTKPVSTWYMLRRMVTEPRWTTGSNPAMASIPWNTRRRSAWAAEAIPW